MSIPKHTMGSTPSLARARLIVTVLGIGWLILAARLLQLQWWQQQRFAGQAEQQREFVEETISRPADIIDRQGRLLATTLTARSLYLVPNKITDPRQFAHLIATAIGSNPDVVYSKITANPSRQFLWIKRRLNDKEVNAVKELKLPQRTWGFREEYRREYPQGVLAAHVLGLRDIDGVGRGGIEERFDSVLRGPSRRRFMARDSRGHVIEILNESQQEMVGGRPVQLTLDVIVQLFAERELDQVMQEWKPESCSAVVMDPNTGEILAMANRPTFNPNHPEDATPDSWKNRVIADIYEPGSTLKPMIVGYGLDENVIHQGDVFDCEQGEYRMGRRVLHDHHRYGELSLTDVLVKSSNIGMAKIGELMGNERLAQATSLFGFGRRTGIELPGEMAGILRPADEWTSYSTGSIPMGHEIATTPLQLITAHAALANGGTMMRPRIVQIEEDHSTAAVSRMTAPTISRETSRWLIENPMLEVVNRGTGKKARIPGYQVFGKTGTAQCLSPDGGYIHEKYISSFVCGAPVTAPRLVVLVVVNQSAVGGETFGGKVAAPAAANILRQSLIYLRVSHEEQWPRAAANVLHDDVEME